MLLLSRGQEGEGGGLPGGPVSPVGPGKPTN